MGQEKKSAAAKPSKQSKQKKSAAAKPPSSDAAVAAYLREHPDFLLRHGELLSILTPPSRHSGENVVDMQSFIIDRLKSDHHDLITTSRGNLAGQSRIHEAVLTFLTATSLEQLVHLATTDLLVLLDVDVVVFAVEGDESDMVLDSFAPGVRLLGEGEVNRLIGPGRDVVLKSAEMGDALIFGEAADLVFSYAFIRLDFGPDGPAGLLALGSRDEDKFHAGQGTELLVFMARALELCVRSCLERPG